MLSTSHLVFIEVAKELSFSKAAQTLFISQPAISNHIKMLESQYQCALFNRKGNTISLTAAGEILYQHLKDAVKIQREIEFKLSTLENLKERIKKYLMERKFLEPIKKDCRNKL